MFFNPINLSFRFSRDSILEIELEVLGISFWGHESEMFLFGLSFSLRDNFFIVPTLFGFQFYFNLSTFAIFWPNGALLKDVWSRKVE